MQREKKEGLGMESQVTSMFKGCLGRRPYKGNREGAARDGGEEYRVMDPKREF